MTSVDGNTLAAKAGVKKGDVLVKIGDRDVFNDPAVYRKLLQELPEDEPLTLAILRDGVRTELPMDHWPRCSGPGGWTTSQNRRVGWTTNPRPKAPPISP